MLQPRERRIVLRRALRILEHEEGSGPEGEPPVGGAPGAQPTCLIRLMATTPYVAYSGGRGTSNGGTRRVASAAARASAQPGRARPCLGCGKQHRVSMGAGRAVH